MAKLPKYLTQENTRKKGKKGEQVVKNTINSGALWFDKCDLRLENCLIEVKETDKKGYRITTKLIEKLINEAYTVRKEPLLTIVFPNYVLSIRIKVR